ncbi:MAG: valine--tRNA ligase [Patescibacteria group bacterium]
MKELPKAYEAKQYENSIYKIWEESGFFNPDNLPSEALAKDGEPFTISLPPPNATGTLHLGHATMLALQDLMVRFNRLGGKKVLWLPGTDHAAIATQNVVEKKIWETEQKSRFDLGREELLRRIHEFVVGTQSTIQSQLRAMGASCDWSRERYTLDEGLSKAVAQVFVKMYNDGLIYRGKRIVNWCTRCGTTLADDEVEYKESVNKFYYLKYGPLIIGTARPETKVLDKIAIVHPDDERYKEYVGREFIIPWILGDLKIKVVADKVTEMGTGTGAMSITPAHSFVDFELAQKYGFEVVDIIGPDGKLTASAGKFSGLKAKEARAAIIEELQVKGLVDHIDENYKHNLSICYRCSMPIEPMPLEQWFVAVDKPFKVGWFKKSTLKKLALEAVRSGQIKIIPEKFEKVYYNWMENLHDWCISRQIWFGHRIPVWYREKVDSLNNSPQPSLNLREGDDGSPSYTKRGGGGVKIDREIYVGVEKPAGEGWVQDPDTLDTWFSSSLWTFSTLGWPNQTLDLKTFHPTSVLETGYDIIFFWVARMILMTKYVLNEVPFKTVYLHGMVRDKQGKKMSKSLGNGIDPIVMIEKYGADALRLSMIIGTTPGNDFRLYEEKIAGYRNFVNKLWNISRYILMTVKEPQVVENVPEAKTLADKWILSRFSFVANLVTEKITKFEFSPAGETLYDFTWGTLADWYLEVAKVEGGKDEILNYLLTQILKLWHPFTPFVTEVLWQEAFGDKSGLLMVQGWPKDLPARSEQSEKEFKVIQDVVTTIRNFRSEQKIEKERLIDVVLTSKEFSAIINSQKLIIEGLYTKVKLLVVDVGQEGLFIKINDDLKINYKI